MLSHTSDTAHVQKLGGMEFIYTWEKANQMNLVRKNLEKLSKAKVKTDIDTSNDLNRGGPCKIIRHVMLKWTICIYFE